MLNFLKPHSRKEEPNFQVRSTRAIDFVIRMRSAFDAAGIPSGAYENSAGPAFEEDFALSAWLTLFARSPIWKGLRKTRSASATSAMACISAYPVAISTGRSG